MLDALAWAGSSASRTSGRGLVRDLVAAVLGGGGLPVEPDRAHPRGARRPPAGHPAGLHGLGARPAARLPAHPGGRGPPHRVRAPHAGRDHDPAAPDPDADGPGGAASPAVRARVGAGGDGRGRGGEEDKARRSANGSLRSSAATSCRACFARCCPGWTSRPSPGSAVHPRAFRRELKGWLLVAVLIALPFVLLLKWWALAPARRPARLGLHRRAPDRRAPRVGRDRATRSSSAAAGSGGRSASRGSPRSRRWRSTSRPSTAAPPWRGSGWTRRARGTRRTAWTSPTSPARPRGSCAISWPRRPRRTAFRW